MRESLHLSLSLPFWISCIKSCKNLIPEFKSLSIHEKKNINYSPSFCHLWKQHLLPKIPLIIFKRGALLLIFRRPPPKELKKLPRLWASFLAPLKLPTTSEKDKFIRAREEGSQPPRIHFSHVSKFLHASQQGLASLRKDFLTPMSNWWVAIRYDYFLREIP